MNVLLLTLPVGKTFSLHLMIILSMCRTSFHVLPSNLPLVAQYVPNFMLNQPWTVGLETRRVASYIGYLQTVVRVYIHPLFLQSLSHLIFNQFHLTLKNLLLERLGPKFSTIFNHSFSSGPCACVPVYLGPNGSSMNMVMNVCCLMFFPS